MLSKSKPQKRLRKKKENTIKRVRRYSASINRIGYRREGRFSFCNPIFLFQQFIFFIPLIGTLIFRFKRLIHWVRVILPCVHVGRLSISSGAWPSPWWFWSTILGIGGTSTRLWHMPNGMERHQRILSFRSSFLSWGFLLFWLLVVYWPKAYLRKVFTLKLGSVPSCFSCLESVWGSWSTCSLVLTSGG